MKIIKKNENSCGPAMVISPDTAYFQNRILSVPTEPVSIAFNNIFVPNGLKTNTAKTA